MARIEAVPEREAGLFGRFAYWFSRRRFGEVIEPLTVIAHHPRLLLGHSMMELALDRSNLVDDRLKELAVMKAALMAASSVSTSAPRWVGSQGLPKSSFAGFRNIGRAAPSRPWRS